MLADLERATFSNITHQSLEFVMYSLMPWLVRWEQSLCKALFLNSERGRFFVKFSVEGLLRGDYETRMRGYQLAIQNGIMSVNEARELEAGRDLSEEQYGDKNGNDNAELHENG